jgi:tRNA 2-thiouridine synthesizing protein A
MEPAGTGAYSLDLGGLKCPLPVLRTRKALAVLPPQSILTVRCTDELAAIDIPNLLRETGDTLIDARREGKTLMFQIRKL